ncbi:hypothetical protein [Streptomyces sp. NPDC052107]|jgi:hypothetical protein
MHVPADGTEESTRGDRDDRTAVLRSTGESGRLDGTGKTLTLGGIG